MLTRLKYFATEHSLLYCVMQSEEVVNTGQGAKRDLCPWNDH